MDDSHLHDEVTSYLAQWQQRRLRVDVLLWLPRGLLAGLVAAAAVAATARFRPILHNREVAYIALALALLGAAGSLLLVYLRRPTMLEQARFFDRLFGLQERASTAIEIQTGRLSVARTMAEQQLADTAVAMSRVDARSRLPLRPRWSDVMMVFLAAVLLVLAVALPNEQSSILAEQQAVDEVISEEIARLQALERRTEEELALDDAGREEVLAPIRRALEELNNGQLSREEAVAALSEAENELRELSEAGNGLAGRDQAVAQALRAAGQPLTEDQSSAALGQALTGGDLAQAAAAANQLADNMTLLSAADQDSLAQRLQESAASLVEVDPELARLLAEAAQALQRGQLDQSREALQEAAIAMQQRRSEQALADQALVAANELQSARGEVATAGNPVATATTGGDQDVQTGPGQGQTGQGATAGSSAGSITGPGTGSDTQEGQGAGGPGPGGGHAETVYVPDYVDLASEEGIEIQLPAECVANPENCGQLIDERPTGFTDEQSLVPYEQVFGDYRNAAIEALEGDYVPLGMKGLVRDYFSSLEP